MEAIASDGTRDWAAFRQQMPASGRLAYFDHAAVAPLSRPARQAIVRWAEEAAAEGDVPWPQWAERVEALRRLAARTLSAQPEEIALVRNTTEGVNFVAEGLDWQAGDNVVIPADEFPTNQYPWLHLARRGVDVRRVPTVAGRLDLDRLDDACDRRTRVVAVSWVGYASGWRIDVRSVAEIAHRRGGLVFLDAIQGLGVFPLDVEAAGVDFLAADGHKWLLSPEGAGIAYIRREHLDRLCPTGVGWNSVTGAHDFDRIALDFKRSAARYEGGSQNMVGLLALKASLEHLLQFGPEALGRRIVAVTDYLCQRLAEVGAELYTRRQPGHESGIVSFQLPGREPQQLRRAASAAGVVLSCRGGRLRASPHAYNNESDVERLLAVLAG